MGILTLLPVYLAVFASVVTASPPQRRQAVSTASVTVTATAFATQTTTVTHTVHPLDVTNVVTLGFNYEYLFTTTLWSLDACISYSYTGFDLAPSQVPTNPTILPETTRRPSTSTVLVTVTSTYTNTVERQAFVTVTDRPPTTTYTWTVPTSTFSTELTVRSGVCTNTGVLSAYLRAAETRTSTSGRLGYTRVTVTQPCATTEIVSRTVPGLDWTRVVTRQPDMWDRFTDGTTVVTELRPSEYFTTVVLTSPTATITWVECNNPTTRITSIYYTTTSTQWATATVTSCPTSALGAKDESPVGSVDGAAKVGNGTYYTTVAGLGHEDLNAAAQATDGAVKAEFTTVLLLSPTIVSTFTGTGVVQVGTPTLTTVEMRGSTVVVDATWTTTTCAQTAAARL